LSTPFDQAFKLFAEDDELGVLRVVAKLALPGDAVIEHLDRELILPSMRVDHLYKITIGEQTTAVHLEAFSSYASEWQRRHSRYAAMIWAKYELKLLIFMFLLTNRGVPKELPEKFEIDAGDLKLRLNVRIIKMWEVPASDLLATNDPAIAAQKVAASGDRELHSRMVLLYGLRYPWIEVLEMMLSEDILKDSAYYKKILNKGEQQGIERGVEQGIAQGRLDGQRRLLRRLLLQRFGALTAPVEEQLRAASESDLERWVDRVSTATSIEDLLN
jgi:hypothetical protein